jgi:AcrR family transcriptional regulator
MSDSSAAPSAILRRVPQQDRGQRRVDRILDAAAELIAEVGVEAASTNAIAARAETSVGSLYQFFPNRDAIVRALAARYHAQFEALKEQTMSLDRASLPLDDMLRGIIEPIAAFCESNGAYRHVYMATSDPLGGPSPEERELHLALVARIEAMIARRTPWIAPAQRHATAMVQVETVHWLLFHALGMPPEERRAVIDELLRMLVCALEPFDRLRPADWPDDAPAAAPAG